MRRISSKMTFFYKRVFPVIWIGLIVLFIGLPLFQSLFGKSGTILAVPFLMVPLIMLAVGYFIRKKLTSDLVDEVLDADDALIVRNDGREERVALADITNVSYSPLINPPRVTLSLRNPTTFGDRVTFCAPLRFVSFASNPVVDELIQRVDAARRGKPARRGSP
jgi:hypothetical protein